MDNIKNNEYYIQKIKTDLEFIVSHMDGVSKDEFYKNDILQDSMMFRMIQISENCKKLTDDYKLSRPELSWSAMAGMRNRIVHDYGSVDLEIVYDTLKNDIPVLLETI
ncbi:MAG: DUF86 domain-containing protein [Eubacterium sp.]|nr:DUF86 domain-containing protein [Eubacterium sp.]